MSGMGFAIITSLVGVGAILGIIAAVLVGFHLVSLFFEWIEDTFPSRGRD